MALWNVYRWEHLPNRHGRPVRLWQGEAHNAPEAILATYAAKPQHRRKNLIARPAAADLYASNPLLVIERDDGKLSSV